MRSGGVRKGILLPDVTELDPMSCVNPCPQGPLRSFFFVRWAPYFAKENVRAKGPMKEGGSVGGCQ